MIRTVLTSPFPNVPDYIQPGMSVVTPHRAAAEHLSVSQLSLYALAKEHLNLEGLNVASQIEASLLLKESIFTTIAGADTPALASRLKQILETVLRTGIQIDTLATFGSPQVKQLAQIIREYQGRLRAKNLVDSSEVIWQAAALKPRPLPLCIYGYFRARKEEISFINAIAGEGSIYYLPCHQNPIFKGNIESVDWLVSTGAWQVEPFQDKPKTIGESAAQRFVDPGAPVPHVEALAYQNAESEVGAILGECKRLINSGVEPSQIALLCRDQETYSQLLSGLSSEYGVPVDTRHRQTLNSTLFGGFVKLLMLAANSGFEFEITARLLMHPFGPGLSHEDWPTARKHRADGADAWRELAKDIGCLEWRTDETTLSEWVQCLVGALHSLNIRARAGEIAREIIAYNLFNASLAELRDNHPERSLNRTQFSTLVEELLLNVECPVNPSVGGVLFHNPDTIAGASYKKLFVMGMAEGMLPGAVVDNSVIDFYERKQLFDHGVEFEEAAEVARWSALSFYFTLLTGVEDVWLSYPVTLHGTEKIQNSYFARLGLITRPAVVRCVSSVPELRRYLLRTNDDAGPDDTLELTRRQFTIEKARESVAIADEYDGAIGIMIDPYQASWSASQFTSIGQCPFKWFAQKLLRLRPADEMDITLSAAMRGSLYHKVLELAVDHARNHDDIRTAALEVLEACFEKAETDEKLGLPVLANWKLQREEHLRTLRKAIKSDAFLEHGAKIISTEQYYKTKWNDLTITGSIDRIDETADGLIAIDYKTSSGVSPGAKNAAGKTLIDVQLSLYTTVALPALYPGKSVKKGVYFSLTKGKVLKKIEPPDPTSLIELIATMHSIMDRGHFTVDPDVDGNACKYCEVDRLCRKGSRLDRKTKSE